MIISTLLLVGALQVPSTNIADLSWMSGCWTLTSGPRTVTEHWLPPAGGTMLGMSRTIVNGKTTEYEFVVVRTGSQGLEYVAMPSGQPGGVFKATRVSASEAIFENPVHDFPSRIAYRRADGGLIATIDGQVDGKPRAVDFAYSSGGCAKESPEGRGRILMRLLREPQGASPHAL